MTIIVATIVGLLVGAGVTYLAVRAQLGERVNLRADLDRAANALVVAEKASSDAQGQLAMLEKTLPATVEAISAKALDANREAFLSEAGLKIGSTVAPVTEQLGALKTLVDALEAKRNEEGGRLDETLRGLGSDTRALALALGGSQSRGSWAEAGLERILEQAGLVKDRDYSAQVSSAGGRPDIVIHLPGDKNVVIDAKAPFDAFQRSEEATNDDERVQLLGEFAKRVRDHVTALSRKEYFKHVQPSPNFVFLYMPSDAHLAAAQEHDRTLVAYALDQKVILATPLVIVTLLRAVRIGWDNENAAEDAQKILAESAKLLGRFKTFADHFGKIGKGLDSAQSAYRDALGSYNSRLMPQARTLAELAPAAAVPPELGGGGDPATDMAQTTLDVPPGDESDTR